MRYGPEQAGFRHFFFAQCLVYLWLLAGCQSPEASSQENSQQQFHLEEVAAMSHFLKSAEFPVDGSYLDSQFVLEVIGWRTEGLEHLSASLDAGEVERWFKEIQRANVDLGFSELLRPPKEIIESKSQVAKALGMAAQVQCVEQQVTFFHPLSEVTTQYEKANFLWETAHENVHLQLQDCGIYDEKTFNFEAKRQFVEGTAQLMALEVLAYLSKTALDPELQRLSQEAFLIGLASVYRGTVMVQLMISPMKWESKYAWLYPEQEVPDDELYDDITFTESGLLLPRAYGYFPAEILTERLGADPAVTTEEIIQELYPIQSQIMKLFFAGEFSMNNTTTLIHDLSLAKYISGATGE